LIASISAKTLARKCSKAKLLPPSQRAFDALIKNDIKDAQKSGKVPVGEKKLKKMNEELYKMLQQL
jgi:hypothetical protein